MTDTTIGAKKDIVEAITDVHKNLDPPSKLKFAVKGVMNATEGMKMANTEDLKHRIRDFEVETDCKGTKGLKGYHFVHSIVTKEQLPGPSVRL
ncbi:hypothetical protein V502_08909 [Pseudogymnoascus sp. VKM F-4520 (FW-2644)]|nr:hypothetical protein V502_08909 [Pseudogymnoascus sp. VKM F-4520 (FW-2644)]